MTGAARTGHEADLKGQRGRGRHDAAEQVAEDREVVLAGGEYGYSSLRSSALRLFWRQLVDQLRP
jgi:hypothetical protein